MERSTRLRIDGMAIHALHLDPPGLGAGCSAVLVHGMVVASNGTLPLGRALAKRGCSVHIPDLPGFGRSDKPRHALDVVGLANALGRWMDEAGLQGADVIGNSFGTQVAGALCASRDHIASRLALLSPTIDQRYRRGWAAALPRGRPDGPPRGGLGGWIQSKARDLLVPKACTGPPPPLRSLLRREYLAAGPARALSTYRHALRDDLRARIADLDIPVLVIRGELDRVVSPSWAQSVAMAAPDGRYTEAPGTSHDGQFNAPTNVANTIVPFLLGEKA